MRSRKLPRKTLGRTVVRGGGKGKGGNVPRGGKWVGPNPAIARLSPLPPPRVVIRRALLVPDALQHRKRRVAGETRIGVGAAAAEERRPAPIGHGSHPAATATQAHRRSEEHTAELQSQANLLC